MRWTKRQSWRRGARRVNNSNRFLICNFKKFEVFAGILSAISIVKGKLSLFFFVGIR
jgi:hypothetical protein